MKAKGFVALPTPAISVVSPVAREEGRVESAKEIADVAVAAHAGLDA